MTLITQVQCLNMLGRVGGSEGSGTLAGISDGLGWANYDIGLFRSVKTNSTNSTTPKRRRLTTQRRKAKAGNDQGTGDGRDIKRSVRNPPVSLFCPIRRPTTISLSPSLPPSLIPSLPPLLPRSLAPPFLARISITHKQTYFISASTFVNLSLSPSPSSTFCISCLAGNNGGLLHACPVSISLLYFALQTHKYEETCSP